MEKPYKLNEIAKVMGIKLKRIKKARRIKKSQEINENKEHNATIIIILVIIIIKNVEKRRANGGEKIKGPIIVKKIEKPQHIVDIV